MTNACAGPISTYNALEDLSLTMTGLLVTFSNPNVDTTKQSQTGDGQVFGTESASGGTTSQLVIFLHAFGSGTGSSEVAGFASVDIIGPDIPYEIDVTIATTNTTVASSFAIPPGTASAQLTAD